MCIRDRYPVSPADAVYAVTTPTFDRITIQLDSRYYNQSQLVIEKEGKGVIKHLKLGKEIYKGFFVNHSELVQSNFLKISLE